MVSVGSERKQLKIVYTGYCDNWLAEMAATHVNKGLEVTDDIVGVMCGNDDLASQAVKSPGRKPSRRTGGTGCAGCRPGSLPADCRGDTDHDSLQTDRAGGKHSGDPRSGTRKRYRHYLK